MRISLVQRILLVAAAAIIFLLVLWRLVDGWSFSEAATSGLQDALAPTAILLLLFLACWGVPDSAWPWSKDKKRRTIGHGKGRSRTPVSKPLAIDMEARIASASRIAETANSIIWRAVGAEEAAALPNGVSANVGKFKDYLRAEVTCAALVFAYTVEPHIDWPVWSANPDAMDRFRARMHSPLNRHHSRAIKLGKEAAKGFDQVPTVAATVFDSPAMAILNYADSIRSEVRSASDFVAKFGGLFPIIKLGPASEEQVAMFAQLDHLFPAVSLRS